MPHHLRQAKSVYDDRVTGNIERWRGFAEEYDRVRPPPPSVLLDWITRYAVGDARPFASTGSRPAPGQSKVAGTNADAGMLSRVVDVGAGTALSTLCWSGRAREVIGIEPSDDMRRVALERVAGAGANNVEIRNGLATATGLPDACADLVTCSQCLHWLEPGPTFAEVARILRPCGVFAAYDCDWPPSTGAWRAESAYATFLARATELERTSAIPLRAHKWDKAGHLERMRASGRFAFVREIVLHEEVQGDAERFIGLALTQGGPATLRKLGVADDELGVPALREAVERALGAGPRAWILCYRLRLGIR
jgi:SAM-dependent methyltransferase